jgi:broad specificity phosphatase PhoE
VKWYIIRHADKETGDFHNPTLRHQDQPISANGRAEAQKLCSYFTGKEIDRIYVSEYIRTEQTIAYVAKEIKQSAIVDSRLNEIDNGAIEGLSEQDLRKKYPSIWTAFRARITIFNFRREKVAKMPYAGSSRLWKKGRDIKRI